jgi:hypothetical protein
MKERFAQLNADLTASADDAIGEELVRLINDNIKPPDPVTANDVYVRSMYIVSDAVNSYGGRFPQEEHERLVSLLVDSPVLVGHRKDGLPIGRTFHAVTVERQGKPWVRSYFYWPKGSDQAEILREHIDKGVYKECSIGFTYLIPECSICGEDIRRCRHNLFQTYSTGSGEQLCHFNYRQIERVLETSLVFRGATPETSITRDLAAPDAAPHEPMPASVPLEILANLNELCDRVSYLVVPHYEGKNMTISHERTGVTATDSDGKMVPIAGLNSLSSILSQGEELHGKLVGYRGKERRSQTELDRYLAGSSGPVTRTVLYLYPDSQRGKVGDFSGEFPIRFFRHRVAQKENLLEASNELATKSGVEIWEIGADCARCGGVRYVPENGEPVQPNSFQVMCGLSIDSAVLRILHEGIESRYSLSKFRRAGLLGGARFVADSAETGQGMGRTILLSGEVKARLASGGYRLCLTQPFDAELRVQPIRLNGRDRTMIYLVRGSR